MITRRTLLRRAAQLVLAGAALGTYAVAGEPLGLRVQRYRPTPPGWPDGLALRIAALADIHACTPWMPPDRLARIVARTNALKPDLVVLLGDYAASHRFAARPVGPEVSAPILAGLRAPLGVHAILGNHDWWDDAAAQRRGAGPTNTHREFAAAGIPVLENDALHLSVPGGRFWLAGLGDQIAFRPGRRFGRGRWQGVDDLPRTLARIAGDDPVLLLAHEPDIFPQVPARVCLTLAGHTHGGQVRLLGHSPLVPSRFGNRYAYGHVRETGPDGRARDLIVSGGLGCSILPVRFGVPPEIVLVELGGLRLQNRGGHA